MKVIILAAGEGTRTRERFPDTPKALIPVRGRPMVEHLIGQYAGFEILLNVRKKDASRFRYLDLPLLIESEPLGNAGAVKYFSKDLGDTFIATHTDVYSDLEANALLAAHKATATMVVKEMGRKKEFGVVAHDGGVVTGFTRQRLINCGIYAFSKEVVDYIGEDFQDFDKDLFPKLIRDKKLAIYEHKGLWEDVGNEEYWAKLK